MVRALGASRGLVVVPVVLERLAERVMRGVRDVERSLVGRRKSGFWRTFSWKMAVAVCGEWARERRVWAMWLLGLLGVVDMVVDFGGRVVFAIGGKLEKLK